MKYASLFLALACSTLAHAATLFDNGGPSNDNEAWRSDVAGTGQQMGVEFTLSAASTLQGVKWWGAYEIHNSPQSTDLFRVQIFPVTDSGPGAIPVFDSSPLPLVFTPFPVSRTATAARLFGSIPVYEYAGTFSNTVLPAGTYLFSVMNDTSSDLNDDWYWKTSVATTGTGWERNYSYPTWADQRPSGPTEFDPVPTVALNLTGAPVVPEPTSLSLLAVIGICGALGGRGARLNRRTR